MKTKALFVSALLLAGCGASSSDELAFEAHGARTASVDASGYGDSASNFGWITAGGWTLTVDLPKTGSSIDALHGTFDLRRDGEGPFSVSHGGTCTVDVSSSWPLTGTFSCTGLANASGETIDVSGHFSISPAPSSSPGNSSQGDPCKTGLPDLYCR